jgi:GT2 family glycosyltransferase
MDFSVGLQSEQSARPALSPFFQERKSPEGLTEARVSVVMITHNRSPHIREALEHLLSLPERPHIMVMDNASTDDTVSLVRSISRDIEVIELGRNLGSASRNIGVARAHTPYVAFSDDDSWWSPGSLPAAADAFDANPALGLIAARILVGPERRLEPLCEVMANSPLAQGADKAAGIPITGFAACGAIVRRTAFLQTGGFELRLGVGGEEQLVALQLLRRGWQMVYLDHIIARHDPSPARDRTRRQVQEVRNALWSAWLRRPASSAWNLTWRLLRASWANWPRLKGLLEAMRGLPWVLRQRDPIPAWVEEQVQRTEASFFDSPLFR